MLSYCVESFSKCLTFQLVQKKWMRELKLEGSKSIHFISKWKFDTNDSNNAQNQFKAIESVENLWNQEPKRSNLKIYGWTNTD